MKAKRFKNLNVVSNTAGAKNIDPNVGTHARPTLVGLNTNRRADVLILIFFVIAMVVFAERNSA
jgi:hypothetical protein